MKKQLLIIILCSSFFACANKQNLSESHSRKYENKIKALRKKLASKERRLSFMKESNLVNDSIHKRKGKSANRFVVPSKNANQLYKFIYKAYQNNNEIKLITGSNLFLKKFNKSILADNVLYLRAIFEYRKGNYPKSLSDLNRIVNDYKLGDKRASAFLLKSKIYKKMNLSKLSLKVLNDVNEIYPETREARTARGKLNSVKEL